MASKKDTLKEILVSHFGAATSPLKRIKWADIEGSDYEGEIATVYKKLGGILKTPPAKVGKWDIELDGIAVELDDPLHFNRYRSITLSSPLYEQVSGVSMSKYDRFCRQYESECLRTGKAGTKWSNKTCEKQFGEPSERGVLSGNGSPKWKQRAFYDFLNDMTPLFRDYKVLRLAHWNEIMLNGEIHSLKDILTLGDERLISGLISYVERKVSKLREPIEEVEQV